jgi:hypothetical protein
MLDHGQVPRALFVPQFPGANSHQSSEFALASKSHQLRGDLYDRHLQTTISDSPHDHRLSLPNGIVHRILITA